AAGLTLSTPMLELMKTPKDVLPLSSLYLRIYFLGIPGTIMYNFGAALLRAFGDTKRPMVFLTVSGVVNACLNLFFVIVCHMSVDGVATATVISQYISLFLVVRCLRRSEGLSHLELKSIRLDREESLRMIQIGLPAGLQSTLFSIANVLVQSSVNSFGASVVAANTAAASIEGFVYTAMNSVFHAAITFTSQNLGAKNYHRIDQTLVRCMCIVTLIGLVLGNGAHLLGNHLLHIYSDDLEVISFGMQRLSVISVTYCLCGMMDVLAGTIRGLGYSMLPMIVSLIGACVFRIIWIFTVFRLRPSWGTP
ncbi:MAG: MATE family efflux transporter, partial [Sutterella sp.]|nr:MATE family efflux transporter [Sutterella sp.]